MANPTGPVKVWTRDYRDTKYQYPVESGSTLTTLANGMTFYVGEMIGLDNSGNVGHMDDAQKLKFVGIQADSVPIVIDSGDAAGGTATNPNLINVEQPNLFLAKIASAAAGDEGKKVFASYSDTVQYAYGTNGNLVGSV